MKILFVLHSTIMGGATISFLNLVSGLKNKDVEITVLFPDYNEEFIRQIEYLHLTFVKCPIVMSVLQQEWKKAPIRTKVLISLRLLKKKYKSYLQLLSIIKKVNPDIIHTNTGTVHEGFLCAKRLGIPHVWHLREYQDKDFHWIIFLSKKLFKLMLRKSYVVSITKDIHSHFGLKDSEKHRIIYNGILPVSETYLQFPKEDFFLCASRISKEKGHDEVIRAFAKFLDYAPSYRLKILGFGDNSYINELKVLCKELDCENSVEFLGYIKNVTIYMRKAKALIVASHNEGFGRMTAEASFCGCCVVGRNTGGTKEIMDAIGGLRFWDEVGLLNSMISISQIDDGKYRDMVMYSQVRAVENYSIENNIDHMISFYKDIMGREKGVSI